MRSAFLTKIFVTLLIVLLSIIPFQTTLAEELKKEIKIGAIYGLTGLSAIWSQQAQRGIELAVEELNRNPEYSSYHFRVVYEDSQTQALKAVQAFRKLRDVDKVDAIIGDMWSFVSLPLAPLAKRYKMVVITPAVFDSEMPANNPYFFTTCPKGITIQNQTEKFLALNPSIKRIGIICLNNTWGQTYLNSWEQASKSAGVEVAFKSCLDDYNSDFRVEVLKSKQLAVDAIFVPHGVERVLRRAKELNFNAEVFTSSDILEAIHIRGLDIKEAEGIYFNDWVANDDFKSRFFERYGHEPIMEPQNSYEAVRGLARGFKIANGDRQKLLEALSKLKYLGVGGAIDFTKENAINHAEGNLAVVRNGKVEIIEES